MTVTELLPLTVRVPSEADFDGADFLDDDVLQALFDDVVASFPRLRVIVDHDIDVRCVWKRKGGKSHGQHVYGRCVKASGLLAHFIDDAFVVWLAADHCEAAEYTTPTIRKLLYHQARHVGWQEPVDINDDGEGHAVLLAPDLEVFAGEIEDTGAWERVRRAAAHEFSQPGLFGAEG